MASFFQKSAASAVEKKIESEINKGMKSFTGVFGRKNEQGPEFDGGLPTIDWGNLNYPPVFRVIHYDPTELPTSVAKIAQLFHWVFLLNVAVSLLNIADNIVLLISSAKGFIQVIYSFLNFILLIAISGTTFYTGYCAVALSNNKKILFYFVLQAILTSINLFFFLAPVGPINGIIILFLLHTLNISGFSLAYWIIAATVESSLHGAAIALSVLGAIRLRNFNPFLAHQ